MNPERGRGRKTSIIVINNSEHEVNPFQSRLLQYLSDKPEHYADISEIHNNFYRLERGKTVPIANIRTVILNLKKTIDEPDKKSIIETITEKRRGNTRIVGYRLRKGTKIEFPEEE